MPENRVNENNGKIKLAFNSNFTQIPNAGLGKELSLAASGLYSRIIRLARIPNVPLTKAVIKSNCCEKNKAFEAVWNELKEKGYITQYLQPKAFGRGWYQEYEIWETPRQDGIHTVYRDKNGMETGKTNLNRDRYPHYGRNGQGIYGNGIYRKGGNKRYINNISLNTVNNNIMSQPPSASQNQFSQFMQQDYDIAQIEKDLLTNGSAELAIQDDKGGD